MFMCLRAIPRGNLSTFWSYIKNIVFSDFTPVRKSVPLLMFQMKLLREGKFLFMMDCQVGGASLAARSKPTPYRMEIAAEAATLNLADGFPACIQERNRDEHFGVKWNTLLNLSFKTLLILKLQLLAFNFRVYIF